MIASPTKPEEALSLTCFRALDFSVHPFAIANPNATPLDGIAWLVEEVGNLHYWIDLVACSKADCHVDPAEMCGRMDARLRLIYDVLILCRDAMVKAEVKSI